MSPVDDVAPARRVRRPAVHAPNRGGGSPLTAPSDPAAELLGALELAVMRALWDDPPASVRSVLDAVNTSRDEPLAYTSVMTVLDRLHDKELVARERQGRAYLYTPVHHDEQQLVQHLGRQRVDDLVARLGDVALVQFAARLHELDPDTREALERLAARRDG